MVLLADHFCARTSLQQSISNTLGVRKLVLQMVAGGDACDHGGLRSEALGALASALKIARSQVGKTFPAILTEHLSLRSDGSHTNWPLAFSIEMQHGRARWI
jgi:hypothetical protein